jgi:glucose/arabinose dehydrogenase
MTLAALVLAAVVLQPAVNGLQRPVAIAHTGDSRLFIVQQTGAIRVWQPPQLLPQPFLDVSSLTRAEGEQGLLGLAFHPRYSENGRFFINYTDLNGHTVVAQYSRSQNDPDRADPASARTILRVNQPYDNHNGGQLQFGPDGYLYIGMGDGGSGGDPQNRAQNPADLLGKMLRIDVDSGEPYGIPPSNPFVNRAGHRPEIWSLGLRNPWRFSFDRSFGDLWIADVGQGQWEEINFQPRANIGGDNYGWRVMEGTHCFEPKTNCGTAQLVRPVIEYNHSNGACSVTGGYVYRGTQSRRLNGTYIYGDFCNGNIWGAVNDGTGRFTSTLLFDAPFLISTFGEDAQGEIYVADYAAGQLYRIVENTPMPGKRRSVR